MAKILSLDVSSVSTGWSIFDSGALVDYGVITTKSKDGWGKRLSHFDDSLQIILNKYSPETIVVEDIYQGPNPVTFKVLAFFHGVTYSIAAKRLELEPVIIKVTSIRRLIGTKLNVFCKTKEHIFHIIKETLGFNDFSFAKHNDITDSIALAYGYFLINGITPEKPLTLNALNYHMIGEDKDGSLQDSGRKQGGNARRDKESLPKAGKAASSGRKSRKQGSRREV